MAIKKDEENLSPLGLRRKLRGEGKSEEEAKRISTEARDKAEPETKAAGDE